MISHERLLQVLSYNRRSGVFRWKIPAGKMDVGDKAGCLTGRGYVVIRIDAVLYLAHRLAWFYVHGEWPSRLDHRDRVKWHNWINNLRVASNSQNMVNVGLTKANTTGVRGVVYVKGRNKWKAQIKINYKGKTIGYYTTREEAKLAYANKARELFGEFATQE